jgi:hypothetical protein
MDFLCDSDDVDATALKIELILKKQVELFQTNAEHLEDNLYKISLTDSIFVLFRMDEEYIYSISLYRKYHLMDNAYQQIAIAKMVDSVDGCYNNIDYLINRMKYCIVSNSTYTTKAKNFWSLLPDRVNFTGMAEYDGYTLTNVDSFVLDDSKETVFLIW